MAPPTLGRSVAAALDLLAPVARLIEEQTRAPGLFGTDATGIPVLDPSTPEGIRYGTIWAWTNARWVTFFYSPTEDPRSVGQVKILLPPEQIAPQLRRHRRHASAAAPRRNHADPLLHRLKGLGCDAAFDLTFLGCPKAVAKKLAVPRARHRAFRLVDSERQPRNRGLTSRSNHTSNA